MHSGYTDEIGRQDDGVDNRQDLAKEPKPATAECGIAKPDVFHAAPDTHRELDGKQSSTDPHHKELDCAPVHVDGQCDGSCVPGAVMSIASSEVVRLRTLL